MITNLRGRSLRESYDWLIVILYIILIFIGWINIYASVHYSETESILDFTSRAGKQLIWMIISMSIGGFIMFVLPTRSYESFAPFLYSLVLILLIAVIFLGVEVKGSRSWFQFGGIKLQPAEISKITTSLMLAFLMSREDFKISGTKDFIMAGLIILIPMLIIIAEKETGSALVYTGFIFMLYREGLSGKILFAAGTAILLMILTLLFSVYISCFILAIVLLTAYYLHGNKVPVAILKTVGSACVFAIIPILYRISPNTLFHLLQKASPYLLGAFSFILVAFILYKAYRKRSSFLALSACAYLAGLSLIFSTSFLFNSVLKDHQRKRIEVLLGLKDDPMGVGYNVNQSMIAIGSGGLNGKGFLKGTQTAYGFVPEQSTDFIFCTIGEEWGFIGSFVVILLYSILLYKIIYDAEKSREAFTRIYGYCTAVCIFMHMLINIGMTIGLMPVIGIPLPFISYGGSSIVSFTIMIFIFVALDHQEKKYF